MAKFDEVVLKAMDHKALVAAAEKTFGLYTAESWALCNEYHLRKALASGDYAKCSAWIDRKVAEAESGVPEKPAKQAKKKTAKPAAASSAPSAKLTAAMREEIDRIVEARIAKVLEHLAKSQTSYAKKLATA